MFTSRHDPNGRASAHLPEAFEQALRRVHQTDEFNDAVTYAAELADCEFLFEIPGILFGDKDARAAVMRPLPGSGKGEGDILYIVFNGENGVISIVEEFEVPLAVYDLTQSYSRVLDQLADDRITAFYNPH